LRQARYSPSTECHCNFLRNIPQLICARQSSDDQLCAGIVALPVEPWQRLFTYVGGWGMPWLETLGSETTPSADEIIRRLAFHIHHRTLDPITAEVVLRSARITRKTLSRYCAYREPQAKVGADLHANGPRRLDLYCQICVAIGENPGKVLWAATVAGDYTSMLVLLSAELHLQQTLIVTGALGLPNTATTRLVSPGDRRLESDQAPRLASS
jgi:hypothetical protein